MTVQLLKRLGPDDDKPIPPAVLPGRELPATSTRQTGITLLLKRLVGGADDHRTPMPTLLTQGQYVKQRYAEWVLPK